VQLLPGAGRPGPGRSRAGVGGRHRRQAPDHLEHLRRVPRSPAGPGAVGEHRAVRGPRRPAPGRGRPRRAPRHARRAERHGAAARGGAGRRRLRLLHRSRVRAQRLRQHGGAGLPRAQHGAPARPLLLPYPRRGGHARAGRRGGDLDRRAGRRARADRPREGVGPGELGQDGPRPAHDRRRARPRRRRHRRRLSLPGGQHQDGQPAPGLDARRRHLEAARAPDRPQGAAARDRRLPGGRRALAHRLGRHGLGRDHDRHLLQARAGRHPPRGAGPAHRPRAGPGHDGSGDERARRRLDGGVLPARTTWGPRSATPTT